jgi:peptidoglycan/LPS O-acetylase OafA/YrhL
MAPRAITLWEIVRIRVGNGLPYLAGIGMSIALSLPAAPAREAANPRTLTLPPRGERLAFIDALRGLAALAVAAYHIERYGPLAEPASRLIAGPLEEVIRHGWMGVQTFYVISGFVIAYSLREAWMTPAYLGNYAVRRSLRLDPPYWATIGVALALHFCGAWLLRWPSPLVESPTWPQFGWHFLYLQNVMGHDNLSVGLWTLCIEVQFYLLYATVLGLAQRSCGFERWQRGAGGGALALWFAPLALVSLVTYRHDEAFRGGGFFWLAPFQSDACLLHYFWMFFLGMLVCWTLIGRTPAWLLGSYLAVMAARFLWREIDIYEQSGATVIDRSWTLEVAVAGLAGAAIYAVGLQQRLASTGNLWPLQFLGRISYSLYLIHYPVSHVIVHGCQSWAETQSWHGTPFYDGFALACTTAALAAAILAGYALYICVERPSLRLAALVRPRPASLSVG